VSRMNSCNLGHRNGNLSPGRELASILCLAIGPGHRIGHHPPGRPKPRVGFNLLFGHRARAPDQASPAGTTHLWPRGIHPGGPLFCTPGFASGDAMFVRIFAHAENGKFVRPVVMLTFFVFPRARAIHKKPLGWLPGLFL
jgi:hypothetical protein